MAEHSRFGRK